MDLVLTSDDGAVSITRDVFEGANTGRVLPAPEPEADARRSLRRWRLSRPPGTPQPCPSGLARADRRPRLPHSLCADDLLLLGVEFVLRQCAAVQQALELRQLSDAVVTGRGRGLLRRGLLVVVLLLVGLPLGVLLLLLRW